MPDNIVIAPWGDLIVCEDNSERNRLWGLTPSGTPYLIAQNSYSGSEFAEHVFLPLIIPCLLIFKEMVLRFL